MAGSSSVHDSAEDTLLTGMGTCRDFAHLGVALCRAVGIPARFAAVYAPGLSPMDFHAVFEAQDLDGRWYAYDATDLAPRQSMVRIVTGRDAADAAFASVNSGRSPPSAAWPSRQPRAATCPSTIRHFRSSWPRATVSRRNGHGPTMAALSGSRRPMCTFWAWLRRSSTSHPIHHRGGLHPARSDARAPCTR